MPAPLHFLNELRNGERVRLAPVAGRVGHDPLGADHLNDVHRPLRNSAEPQLTIGELLALVRTGTGSVRGGSPTAGRRPMNGEPLEAGSSQLEGVDS